MQTVNVELKGNKYPIMIGSGILPRLGKVLKPFRLGDDAVIVTNRRVRGLFGKLIARSLAKSGISVKFFEVPDSEESKSSQVAFDLINKIVSYDTKRKIFIIALGGGVVGDLAGYVAAIYKRGVPYIQVPTTFLAQIDSAIGGKVAIDLPTGKNLVGAFYQPKLVYSDVAALKTLGRRQIRNGLAEAVKYGVIRDKRLFEYIKRNRRKIFANNTAVMTKIVLCCSKIKADVVAHDEKETKGIRTILNFGHTIGHAIETAGGYKQYHHGEAVALGMRAAGDISCRLGLLKKKDCLQLEDLLTALGLPARIKKLGIKKILISMAHDKKFKAGKNRFVLLCEIGKVKIVEGVPLGVIEGAVKARL